MVKTKDEIYKQAVNDLREKQRSKIPEIKTNPATGNLEDMIIYETPLFILPRAIEENQQLIKSAADYTIYPETKDTYGYKSIEFSRENYNMPEPLIIAKLGERCFELSKGVEIPIIDTRLAKEYPSLTEFHNDHPIGVILDPSIPYSRKFNTKRISLHTLKTLSEYLKSTRKNNVLEPLIENFVALAYEISGNKSLKK